MTPGEERAGGTSTIGEAIERLMGSEAFTRYSGNERATQAWFMANGDFERRHTRGVFLRESGERGEAPTLVVYIDTNSILQDFVTNRDIYAIRLAHYGFDVARVEFRLARDGGVRYVAPTMAPACPPAPAPPLSPDEEAFVEDSVASLEEPLRSRVRAAMASSLRRDKRTDTMESKSRS